MQGTAWNGPSRVESPWERAGTALCAGKQNSPGPRTGERSPAHCRDKEFRQEKDLYSMGKGGVQDPSQMESLSTKGFPLPTEGADFSPSLFPNP